MTIKPVRVLVVGDPYFTTSDFRRELTLLEPRISVSYLQIETTQVPPPRTASEMRLSEYAGDPADITRAAAGHEVIVVHGAPVSEETLSVPGLQLVCCARGGPVNIDLTAATERGIAVCAAPGKNAAAVAELTIAFALMQIRGVPVSSRDVLLGKGRGLSVFDGRNYFGTEAPSTTLGLIGYGRVGRQVSSRAQRLGFTVIAHDPFAHNDSGHVEMVELPALLQRADVVSLHARLTPDTHHLMGPQEFALMRRGAYFINTAREQMVDEAALFEALRCGAISGAALDVIEQRADRRSPLHGLPQVLITPHIGGATRETLLRGAGMVAAAVEAFVRGEPLPNVVNPEVLADDPIGSRSLS